MMNTSKIGQWASKSRWRFTSLLIVLMILPIATFSFYIGQAMKGEVEAQAGVESTQIARVSATLVEEHFRQSTAFLQSISTRRTLRKAWQEGDLITINWHLEKAKELRPDFSFVSVYTPDGTLKAIYPPRPEIIGHNYAFRDWYNGVSREWKPYVSEVYRSAVYPNDLVVAIAIPLYDDKGKPIGIMMGADPLKTLSQRLVGTNLQGGWNILLVDQNGHLGARKNIATSTMVDLAEYEPVKELHSGKAGQGIFSRDSASLFTRYEPVPSYPWGVLVEQPSSLLQQNVRAAERRVWLLGLGFVAVGVVVSFLLESVYTQLKQALQQIEQQNKELELRNHEIERATKMKSKFLASMSHELRTPLNAIVGFSDLLSEQTSGPLTEKQTRFVNHIKTGAAHLLKLINDILDLSKIEAGLLDIHCEEFPAKEALPEVMSVIEPLAAARKINLELKLADEPRIFADRIRFRQVLYNLLSNAVKFTPKDGRVEVHVCEEDEFVSFSVSDTGIGICPEIKQWSSKNFARLKQASAVCRKVPGWDLRSPSDWWSARAARFSYRANWVKEADSHSPFLGHLRSQQSHQKNRL